MKRKPQRTKKTTKAQKLPIQEIRHPEVIVNLVGEDGNAFSILGRVRKQLRQANVPQAEIDAFFAEATNGDYDHLLRTVMTWVTVE